MTQDVNGKLNPGLPYQSRFQREEECSQQENWLKSKEEISEMLHFEYGFVLCLNVDKSNIR